MDDDERRKELAEALKIVAVAAAVGMGLLLMTVVIPWLKRLFAGSLAAAVFISALGVGAYLISDYLVKKEVISGLHRLTAAKLILLAMVLIGAWFG